MCNTQCLACNFHYNRYLGRFVCHKDNIGCFDGSIRAKCAHCDTHIRPCKYRSIIDTISDEYKLSFLALLAEQFFYTVNLISREQFCIRFIQSQPGRYFLSHGIRIAGKHDGLTDTAFLQLFYPQLGVKLCSMAGGGVQKIYMVFLREPSRRDRSGSDLFHLRDGFEIKMNFDRNVSCFIFVNALMHDDFFD